MNKKVIIYLGGILLLIIIVVGFILFLNGRSKAPAVTTTTNTATTTPTTSTSTSTSTSTTTTNTQTQNPPAASRLTKLTTDPVIAPILSVDGTAVWYFTADGSSFKIRLDNGLKQEFLLQDKKQISDAIWPSVGSDFILVSGTGINKTFRYEDTTNTTGTPYIDYAPNVKGVDFQVGAQGIFYNWVAADGTSRLNSADLKNTQFSTVTSLPEAGLTIKASSSGDKVLAYNDSDPKNGKLYLVLIPQKKVITLKTAVDNSAIWSPDGKHFLYNRNDDGTGTGTDLWLGDATAIGDKDLGVATSVSKAVFDQTGKNLYVAVTDQQTGSDVIWKIDLSTFQKTQVFAAAPTDTPSSISATNLLISPDGTALFFKNSDGYLYGYKIGQ